MSDLAQLIRSLDQIVSRLRRLGRRTPDLLQAPLTPAIIAQKESALPFLLTDEVKAIYQWRNGTRALEGDVLDELYFFPGFYLLSMDEAVEIYHEREGSAQWRAGWYPLFADGGGDFYIVPCIRALLDESEVIGFLHGEPEQIAEYENVTAMMQTLDAAYAEGAFFVEDGTLEIDDDAYARIANRFNPRISEWQN